MMFNNNIKQRYIDYKNNSVVISNTYLLNVFNKCFNYETELNKDLCNFTHYEILNMYKTWNISALDYLYVINNTLALYTDWCIMQNLVIDFQNHYKEISRHILSDECINKIYQEKKIISREELYEWCSMMRNPSDAFVLIALFDGLEGSNYTELANAVVANINEEKQIYSLPRGDIKISHTFIKYAFEAVAEQTYYGITGAGERQMPLAVSDLIVKPYINTSPDITDVRKGRNIYNRLARIFKYLDVYEWMTARALIDSGRIDFINRRCKELNVSVETYLRQNNHAGLKELNYQFYRPLKDLRISLFCRDYKSLLIT